MQKVFFSEFYMLQILKRFTKEQWNVRLDVWQKLQSPKIEICKPKIQHKSNDLIKQLFEVLSLIRERASSALAITALSITLCFSSGRTERCCTENYMYIYSVLPAC